jgi:predicted PurR-regulated permease PerM
MKEDFNQKTVISFDGGSIVKAIFIIILFIFLFIVRDLVLVILASVVIASSIEPATLWFAKYHIGRIPAVIVTYVGVAGLFFAIFFFFVPSVLDETSSFLSSVPQYFDSSSSGSVSVNHISTC